MRFAGAASIACRLVKVKAPIAVKGKRTVGARIYARGVAMRRDTEQLANVFVDCRHAYLVDVLVKRFDSRNGTCRQAFKVAAAHVAKPASEIHHGNASIDDAVGKMPDANGVGRACASASIAADAKREQALLVLRSWRTKKVPLSGKGFYRSPERNQRARRDAAFYKVAARYRALQQCRFTHRRPP